MNISDFLKTLPKGLNPADKLVLMAYLEKPHLKRSQAARMLDVSERTVYRAVSALKAKGIDLTKDAAEDIILKLDVKQKQTIDELQIETSKLRGLLSLIVDIAEKSKS